MRLIDANVLLDDAFERYCKDCGRRKGIKAGKWRVIYEIGEAPCRACSVDDMKCEIEDVPTIEAIPIEWIEEWFKKVVKYAYDGDDVAVPVMLNDWRRENETD